MRLFNFIAKLFRKEDPWALVEKRDRGVKLTPEETKRADAVIAAKARELVRDEG